MGMSWKILVLSIPVDLSEKRLRPLNHNTYLLGSTGNETLVGLENKSIILKPKLENDRFPLNPISKSSVFIPFG